MREVRNLNCVFQKMAIVSNRMKMILFVIKKIIQVLLKEYRKGETACQVLGLLERTEIRIFEMSCRNSTKN